MSNQNATGLYIAMVSVHGLIRSHDMELGRDADTGGQSKYVVELARALALQPGVAGLSGGVFVNPALTEPFGLTLIEAAASGVPIVATEDGGPRDIIGNCKNGVLIDPLDNEAIAAALVAMLEDPQERQCLADNGLIGVRRHYAWDAHAVSYLREIRSLLEKTEVAVRAPLRRRPMLYHDRAIFTDLDQNLLEDPAVLPRLQGLGPALRRRPLGDLAGSHPGGGRLGCR